MNIEYKKILLFLILFTTSTTIILHTQEERIKSIKTDIKKIEKIENKTLYLSTINKKIFHNSNNYAIDIITSISNTINVEKYNIKKIQKNTYIMQCNLKKEKDYMNLLRLLQNNIQYMNISIKKYKVTISNNQIELTFQYYIDDKETI